ncbi:MAG: hypothetical protein CSA09_03535 [Candidatus Contendobacter odensis]|uniref:InsA N-terminal zinc ribbon domain-containing protein n=1 Tax=Candidatus Contendibacter odensensis TaxID=1400860 RepID=A0A2G6PF17_9GAMM|nr:MAG: hypothetical protein CSA09_03535 [Candidatus Contendobacter odensis]
MVKITLHCPYCQSDRPVKNGRTEDGRQRYLYRACCRRHPCRFLNPKQVWVRG